LHNRADFIARHIEPFSNEPAVEKQLVQSIIGGSIEFGIGRDAAIG
jgi:hypothetical protein